MLHQEGQIAIDNDIAMSKLFQQLDFLSAIKQLYIVWSEENKEDWYSKELLSSLNRVMSFVNQLASYISTEHASIDVQIDYDINLLKGKEFATVVKRLEEWKVFKTYFNKVNINDFTQQSLTVQSLVKLISIQTKEFIRKF